DGSDVRNNTFINNTISNATLALVYIDSNATANVFSLNNFTNTSGYYVQDLNGSNHYNTTINGVPAGNIYFNVINGSVHIVGSVPSVFPGLFYGSAGFGYPYSQATSQGKVSGNVYDYGPLTNISTLCMELKVPNSVYTLNANASINGSTCFVVSAQNVTLDCNGFSIIGNRTPNTYGIFSNQFNTTVKNCIISSFYAGIYFSSATNGSLLNNTALNNSYAGFALFSNSHFNTLLNNKAINNTQRGFVVATSNLNILNNSYVEGSDIAFRIDAANSNRFNNLSVFFPTQYGIHLLNSAAANNFSSISIKTSSASGIYVESGPSNFFDCQNENITGSNISGTYGIYVNAANTTVKNCSINKYQHGIWLALNANNSIILFNNVSNNTAFGMLSNASNINLTENAFCFNFVDLQVYKNGSGTRNKCDSYSGWQEEGHFGCTFACTSLWHRFFGNISGQIMIGSSNVSPYVYTWKTEPLNVYIADYDSTISWSSLQAIGRNITNGSVQGDFIELDLALGTSSFPDNITRIYSVDGSIPKETQNLTVYGREIAFVPVANSTIVPTSFKTGILWDTSNGGTRFNSSLKQTIVWVVRANASTQDAYGTYDFLIQIPYTLAMYNGTNNLVAIYAELK
ncbi:MAG: right-handed parallel beta-helix repeat-containing protein, partial [Candidatus Anstonellaceae archaeon]